MRKKFRLFHLPHLHGSLQNAGEPDASRYNGGNLPPGMRKAHAKGEHQSPAEGNPPAALVHRNALAPQRTASSSPPSRISYS